MKQILGEEMFLTRMPFSGVAAIVIGIRPGPIFEKPIMVPRFKHAGNIWKGPIMAQVVPRFKHISKGSIMAQVVWN